MGKKRSNLSKSCLSSALVILLSGCMTQGGNLKPDEADHQPAQTTTQEPEAISSSRDQAIAVADEQQALDDTLNSALPEEDVALSDEENNPPEETDTAVDDPTSEDEGTTGEAVFDAAQELLDKNAATEQAAPQDKNIWAWIRAGFTLPDHDHPRVQPDIDWFASHTTYLDRTFTRASPYLHYIAEEVKARQMPMEIALLPVVESAYQPFAYSHSRAAGIWQFIPGTAHLYGLKINWWYDGRRDIHASTEAALTYLQKLHDQFNGDWLLALAAYNSGEGTVNRAIAHNTRKGLGTRFWDLDLPAETRSYVPRLLAISDIVQSPEKYGITLRDIPNKPMLEAVNIGSQLDLAIAADMAGMTLEELYTFNPGFNRWATAPNGPHRLLLPLEKVDDFKTKLAALPSSQRMRWTRHEIRQGESLGKIAEKYGITVAAIQRANKLHGNLIRAGQALMIPMASRSNQEYVLSVDQRLETKQSSGKGRNKIIYTVRNGDSFWEIATKHNVGVRTLASWNNMAPRDTLRPGQKLVIWKESQPSSFKLSHSDRTTQKVNYRVRNGDSLARISQRFNVTVSELKKWNPNVNSKFIQPGQHLVVYVDVTKVAGNG